MKITQWRGTGQNDLENNHAEGYIKAFKSVCHILQKEAQGQRFGQYAHYFVTQKMNDKGMVNKSQ